MNAFDPRNYQIVFEEAIKCSQFRRVFQQFLEKHHNQESILFINKVIEYTEEYKKIAGISADNFSLMMLKETQQLETDVARRVSVQKIVRRNLDSLQEKMNAIVKTFLQVGGEQELNIGPHQRSSLKLWKETSEKLNNETFSFDSQEILDELHPGKLLGSIILVILVDLGMGHFTKFSRSDQFHYFLHKMGIEYTRKIGIDISKGYKVDLRFKPHDLKSPIVTDDHIYFGITLAQDTPDWKVVYEKNNLTVTTSRTGYVFNSDQLKGFKLCKLAIDLPYNLEDVWGMWTNPVNHQHFEPMFCNALKYLDYIEPNQDFHGMTCPYGIKIMTTTFDTKIPLLKKRFVESSVTCIKDAGFDMYMILLHSAQFPKGVTSPPPNSLIIDGLCYYIMMRVNDNTTRFMNIMYTDFQLPLQNLTVGQFCKMRGKTMAKGLNFILDKLTDGGKHPVDTSNNDDRGVSQRIVNDNMKSFPNRSWFMEWKESQSKYNSSQLEE